MIKELYDGEYYDKTSNALYPSSVEAGHAPKIVSLSPSLSLALARSLARSPGALSSLAPCTLDPTNLEE